MQKTAIITCFSYSHHNRYVFNPAHPRADLKRVLSFAMNRVCCHLRRIYVLTDLKPDPHVKKQLLRSFLIEVRQLFREWELRFPNVPYIGPPLRWLREVCLHFPNWEQLYSRVVKGLRPGNDPVEFASLFTTMIIIAGQENYRRALEDILNRPMTHLFFYYSGHGVKLNPDRALVIPNITRAEYITQANLWKIIGPRIRGLSVVLIFDCCHAHNLIDLRNCTQAICLASSQSSQTCGFFPDGGSLFTYCLLQFFELHHGPIPLYSLDKVETQIGQKRFQMGKPPQNMGITYTGKPQLPDWLLN